MENAFFYIFKANKVDLMKKTAILTILSLLYLGVIAQEAKLKTNLKPYVKSFPKVNVLFDKQTATLYTQSRGIVPTWVFNSKLKIRDADPLIVNFSNITKVDLDKNSRSILVEYKIDTPEILSLHQLAETYCKVEDNNVLFSIDNEPQKKPESVYITIDAIKQVRVINSENYPPIGSAKNNFVVIDITTVNPPKKKADNQGKPVIYIR